MPRIQARDLFQAYQEYIRILLSNLFLMNGGAAVAILAFFGNIEKNKPGAALVTPEAARDAIICFIIGAFSAVMATALSALTEMVNHQRLNADPAKDLSYAGGVSAVLFILVSFVFFVLACFSAIGLWTPPFLP